MISFLKKIFNLFDDTPQRESYKKSLDDRFYDIMCNISKAQDSVKRTEAVLNGDETWFLKIDREKHGHNSSL